MGTILKVTAPGNSDYHLHVGLRPFVMSLPSSGQEGTPVKILGTDLAGATSVTFNGTPADFAIASATLIETAVPPGATTGRIEVATAAGTLLGNVAFQVRP